MIYDLSIAWTPATRPDDLQRTLRFSKELGYHVVALNHIYDGPVPAAPRNPLPALGADAGPRLPEVLHRVTVPLGDNATHARLPQLAGLYDILAVRPATEKDFTAACLSMDAPALISLDLTQHFPFHFRPKPCMAAVNRGLRFEVCYAQVLGAAGDARRRANFLGNLGELVRATRGRGLVVSSEARDALGLRAPADVVNLLAVWGLAPDRGADALGPTARGVVVNEGIKRRGFRGIVDIVHVAPRPPPAGDSKDGGEEEEKEDRMEGVEQQPRQSKGPPPDKKGNQNKHGGNNNNNNNDNAQGKKRKGNTDAERPEGTLSKRQVKKLRMEALAEEKKKGK